MMAIKSCSVTIKELKSLASSRYEAIIKGHRATFEAILEASIDNDELPFEDLPAEVQQNFIEMIEEFQSK